MLNYIKEEIKIIGAFKVKNNDKLKGIFIGFVKGKTVELFTYGERIKLNINDVEPMEVL
jgi:hypothetical protein